MDPNLPYQIMAGIGIALIIISGCILIGVHIAIVDVVLAIVNKWKEYDERRTASQIRSGKFVGGDWSLGDLRPSYTEGKTCKTRKV